MSREYSAVAADGGIGLRPLRCPCRSIFTASGPFYWCAVERPEIFRRVRAHGRRRLGFDELQDELVLGLRRIRRVLVTGVVGIAQESPFRRQLEARRFDFLAQEGFLDTMQRARLGDAGA